MAAHSAPPIRLRLVAANGASISLSRGRVTPNEGRDDLTVPVGDSVILPGLINAHDHLHRNHYPRLGSPPYQNAYEWGEDLHRRHGDMIARAKRLPRRDALLFGALKNLLAGVTAVVHHDPWESVFEDDFPIRVARVRVAHSPRLAPRLADVASSKNDGGGVLCVHLAEGRDEMARQEILDAARDGLLGPAMLAVHVVGADTDGVRLLRASGAVMVWCPTSNFFLFGQTAPAALLTSGIPVALGTDSLLTGDGTLLDELRAARQVGFLDGDRLTASVSRTPAQLLGIPNQLAEGMPADLVVLARPLLEADLRDVRLVLVGGLPRYGDAEFVGLFERYGVLVERITVKRVSKVIAAPLASVAARVFDLFQDPLRILS